MTTLMTWLVITNSTSCRIFVLDKQSKTINLIKELYHEASRLKDSELVSDRPGHYKSDGRDGSARGSFSPRERPHEVEIEKFSAEVAKELYEGKTSNQCNKLILVAPAHMMGLLNQHMNKQIKECIVQEIIKDYGNLKAHEILGAVEHEIGKHF